VISDVRPWSLTGLRPSRWRGWNGLRCRSPSSGEGISQGAEQADGSVLAEPTFDVCHVAEAVLYMAGLQLDANVLFLTITATKMPFIGRD